MKKMLWLPALLCLLLAMTAAACLAEEEGYAAVAGEWLDEDGSSRLVIDGEGFFSLADDRGLVTGLLAFSGSADELMESLEPYEEDLAGGVRYVLYLENGDPAPGDAWLLYDESYPYELAYISDEDARVYLRGDAVLPYEMLDVQVQWALDALRGAAAYDEVSLSQDPMAARIAFTAADPVQDFRVLSLRLRNIPDGGLPIYDVGELFAQPALSPDRPLVVTVLFEGSFPNVGISYVDASGQAHRFAVGLNGEDGSLSLWEIEIGNE